MNQDKPSTLPPGVIALSLKMKLVAEALDDLFKEIAGSDDVSFVLLAHHLGVTQYTANVEREDGRAWVQDMLDRWESGTSEIPAHLNPALEDPAKDPDLH